MAMRMGRRMRIGPVVTATKIIAPLRYLDSDDPS